MTLILIAAAILGSPATVTFECPATRVEQVLKTLEPITGLRFQCAELFRQTPLVISAHDVPTRELLEHIAHTVGGAWRTEKGVDVLYQPVEVAKAERDASFAAQVAEVKQAIADTFKKSPEPLNATEVDGYFRSLNALAGSIAQDQLNRGLREAYQAQSMRSPSWRALSRLVRFISPEEIVRGGRRVVFAMQPTPRQRPLGPGAADVLRDLQVEQELWARTLARLDPQGESRRHVEMSGDPLSQLWPPQTGATLRLVVRRTPGAVNFDLMEVAENAPESIGLQRVQMSARSDALNTLYGGIQTPLAGDDPIPLSPLAKELAAAVRVLGTEGVDSLNPALKLFLQDPVTHDPLSLAPSECMLELAKQRKAPLVAWLTEQMGAIGAVRDSITLKQFLASSQVKPGGLEYKIVDGWIVARPFDPVTAREEHLDRTALRRFAQSIEQERGVRLLNFAELAASSQSPRPAPMANLWMLLFDGLSTSLLGGTTWEAARLYGLLSPDVRRSLEQGGTVRFDRLSPTQKDRFEDLAFSTIVARSGEGPMERWMLEPTVLLARGVPGEAELALEVRSDSVPYRYQTLSSGRVMPLMVAEIGRIASIERSGTPPDTFAGYAMGTQSVATVRFAYAADLGQSFKMVGNAVDAHARPVPWTELPAPFPEQIRDYLKRMAPPPAKKPPPPHD